MEDYLNMGRANQDGRAQGNAQAVSIIHQTEEGEQNSTQILFSISASSNIHLLIYKT